MRHLPNTPSASVLVVEDDDLIRWCAVDFIEDAGFVVHSANSADAAVAILETRSDIGAVFTDVNMPGSMDGLQLARLVRGRWPWMRVIVTSGRGQVPKSEFPHGSHFVGKPYAHSTIVGILDTVLPIRVRLAETA